MQRAVGYVLVELQYGSLSLLHK